LLPRTVWSLHVQVVVEVVVEGLEEVEEVRAPGTHADTTRCISTTALVLAASILHTDATFLFCSPWMKSCMYCRQAMSTMARRAHAAFC